MPLNLSSPAEDVRVRDLEDGEVFQVEGSSTLYMKVAEPNANGQHLIVVGNARPENIGKGAARARRSSVVTRRFGPLTA